MKNTRKAKLALVVQFIIIDKMMKFVRSPQPLIKAMNAFKVK